VYVATAIDIIWLTPAQTGSSQLMSTVAQWGNTPNNGSAAQTFPKYGRNI